MGWGDESLFTGSRSHDQDGRHANIRYGKCPKISNTLKFRTPSIFAQNNFWKCPKISNSGGFAKRRFLKFRTQLSSSNFLSAHSNFGNVFCFVFFFRYGTGN